MKKKLFLLSLITFIFSDIVIAQQAEDIINEAGVTRIERILSSDEMGGRKVFTSYIDKAADFISEEFRETGLDYFDGLENYKQKFSMVKQQDVVIGGTVFKNVIPSDKVFVSGTVESLTVDQNSGFKQIEIREDASNPYRDISSVLSGNQNTVVWIHEKFGQIFGRLKDFIDSRPVVEGGPEVIFVLHDMAPVYIFKIERKIEKLLLANVVGMIPGKTRPDEMVVFSSHYDHLGIGRPDAQGDSIYNGANDDASGTTAVILLAKYFKMLNNNARTLVFVTFTAEEIGGFGSQYFSKQLNPDNVIAMFNIEMIGTDSKWGTNSAYITGYERTNFGEILQKNLRGSKFHFEPDPYPEQNLFFRSDNATLAALGVPAHTISTGKMDDESHYHQPSDEIQRLDMKNMTEIIKSIAISSKTIVSGEDTPTRVEVELR